MSRPLERTLIVVVLAGLAAVVPALRGRDDGSLPSTTSNVTSSTTLATAARIDYPSEEAPALSTTVIRGPITTTGNRVNDPVLIEPPGPINTRSREATVATAPDSHRSTPTTAGPPPARSAVSTSLTPLTTGRQATTTSQLLPIVPRGATAQPETPGRCATVQELWEADGYPVEDACTLEKVKQVFNRAWTGTDRQRRSAIRNSHLLDEVFVALDEYGRTHDAGLFDPGTRGEWTVVFHDIRWRGGPRYDRAVVAVTHGFVHPDYPHSPRWTSTAVQVGGEWKLSYRRSYCLQADAILESTGSEVRCPPDPDPGVNEHEDPDAIREY